MACQGGNPDNYVRCHVALQHVCLQALPCIENAICDWHQNTRQTLPPCSNPRQCPPKGKFWSQGKPSGNKAQNARQPCQNCTAWIKALGDELFSLSVRSYLVWENFNPTLLYSDPLEVAKAFVLRLPQPTCLANFSDFDPASLIMLMMRFKEFHKGDQVSYTIIKRVSEVRNTLSHMKVSEQLQLSQQQVNDFFTCLFDLVNCLESLHPVYFDKQLAQDTRDRLNDILSSPVTAEMTEDALKPLTNAMKEVVYQTMEEKFQEFSVGLTQQFGKQTDDHRVIADTMKEHVQDVVKRELENYAEIQSEQVVKGVMKKVSKKIEDSKIDEEIGEFGDEMSKSFDEIGKEWTELGEVVSEGMSVFKRELKIGAKNVGKELLQQVKTVGVDILTEVSDSDGNAQDAAEQELKNSAKQFGKNLLKLFLMPSDESSDNSE